MTCPPRPLLRMSAYLTVKAEAAHAAFTTAIELIDQLHQEAQDRENGQR